MQIYYLSLPDYVSINIIFHLIQELIKNVLHVNHREKGDDSLDF